MSNAARTGRRRRLLHEGSLGSENHEAGNHSTEASASVNQVGNGNRYAMRADSVSFLIAKRLFPQSWGAFASVACGLIACWAMLLAVGHYGMQALGIESSAAQAFLNLGQTSSLNAWLASVAWLGLAFVSLVLFGMRRQRMDDMQSRYRWWLLATAAATALSMNAVTGVHQLLAGQLAQSIGWSPMPMNAFWWFLPALLVLGGLAVRLTLEMSESRVALTVAILAMVTLTLGWGVEAATMPESIASLSPVLAWPHLGASASLLGTIVSLLTTLLYARHVVLEAEGVIAKPAIATRTKRKASSKKAARSISAADEKTNSQEEADTNSLPFKLTVPAVTEELVEEEASVVEERAFEEQDIEEHSAEEYAAEESYVAEHRAAEQPEVAYEEDYAAEEEASSPTLYEEAAPYDDSQSRNNHRAQGKRQRQPKSKKNRGQSDASHWDGGEDVGYQDDGQEEQGPSRKMSKSERKRMRKQKERRAA